MDSPLSSLPEFPASEWTSGAGGLKGIWLCDMTLDLRSYGLVKGLLDSGTLSVVYGEPGCGKTFFATDLAFHVAQGAPWRGSRVAGGPVLYVAAEGGSGLRRRLEALCRDLNADRDATPFRLLTTCPNLHAGSEDAERVALEANTAQDEHGSRCRLIVIDTLARVIAGGDENNPQDMGQLLRNIQALQTETGAHVMLIHHSGKTSDRGPRGHSSLLAAADSVIQVTKRDDLSIATVTKQKDGDAGRAYSFRLEQVSIGTDEDGDPITTCVLRPVDGELAPASQNRLSDKQSIALEALADAINTGGEEPPPNEHIPPGKSAVRMQAWKDYCKAKHLSPSDTQDALRKAFDRAKDGLQTKGRIGVWQDWVWMADKQDLSGPSGHPQE